MESDENECGWRLRWLKLGSRFPPSPILGFLGLVTITTPLLQGGPIDKEGLLSKYRDRFVVVIKEGISTGVCEGHPGEKGLLGEFIATIDIVISGPELVHTKSPLLAPPGCGRVAPEPARKGEVLKVHHVAFHGGYLQLDVENVSPHAISRGVGAFEHESAEQGRAFIRIRAGKDGKDLDEADELAARWFRPSDDGGEAPKLGDTAAGVFVNEVKVGMSFAEVEQALGLPRTRVDLGERVLYKYRDMTVEFHEGRVADVR
ncbi:MAG: hypothetical protein ACLQGV_04060 [Bryobacteraceae bacterium]